MEATSIDKKTSFGDLPLSPSVLQAVAEAGYENPTEVQAGVIPLVMAGIDLIVQSQTGTGKTAAFAIPMAELFDPDPGVIQGLVLAPTRELALQVTRESERVGCAARGLKVVTVYGGASISDQIRGIKSAEIVVATPGRMLDLLRRKAASLENLKVFVLDEADEMLSMGFEKELRAIVEYLPEERQSLMFSATVTESIRDIGAYILSFPEFVSFSSDSLGAEEIEHYYYMVAGVGRLRDLHRVIQFEEPENALIFCNTRDDSFRVANYLKRLGYDADVLNGDLPQAEREQVMGLMKAGKLRFLVATDIAARGIDISFLPCVINFTLPESAEGYVHRTGRTGRAGREGVAVSLISPREIGMFYQLRRAYKFDLTARVLPSDEELIALRQRRALDALLEGLDAREELDYGPYLAHADAFVELPDRRARLAKLMAFFVRERDRRRAEEAATEVGRQGKNGDLEPHGPSGHPEGAEEVKPRQPPRDRRSRSSRSRSAPEPARSRPGRARKPADPEAAGPQSKPTMIRIRVNVGRDMVDSPDRLVSLLAELSGMEMADLGRARIFDDHSLVEVRDDLADDIIQAIDHERIGEHELLASR